MLGTCLENVRTQVPLVHNITNYVTVNDVANVLLACGGSPIMADEAEEVEDITTICGGLNINIGTLNKRTITGMLLAGKRANELGHPVLLDPVGAGASALRTNTAIELMDTLHPTVIRGNISEIKTLASGSGTTKGVDADVADAVTEDTLDQAVAFVKNFAKQSVKDGKLSKDFHCQTTKEDLYSYVRIEDINALQDAAGLQREQIVAADGAANYIRPVLNAMDEETYQLFIDYHLATCERPELLGASAHTLDILRKESV